MNCTWIEKLNIAKVSALPRLNIFHMNTIRIPRLFYRNCQTGSKIIWKSKGSRNIKTLLKKKNKKWKN